MGARKPLELQTKHLTKVEKESFSVQTGKGQLKVLELQIPGKKRMGTGEFLRGYHLQEGIKLQ